MHINDLVHGALQLEGFDGISDWLLFELPDATDGQHVDDLWAQLFNRDGVAPGAHPDRLFAWLGLQQRAEAALPDRWYQYWLNRAGRALVVYAGGLLNDR